MKTVLLLSMVMLSACASLKPAPVDFHVNVAEDLAAVEADVKASRDGEVVLLAKSDLDEADRHARRAAEKRRMTARRDDVLEELGLAHAHLDRAHRIYDDRAVEIADVLEARQAARGAGAHQLDETKSAFAALDRMIQRSFPARERRQQRLIKGYHVLEVTGVEARELAAARADLLEARRRRAPLVAPESLATAERAYFAAVDAIDADPQRPAGFEPAVAHAVRLAHALVAITVQAREVGQRSDEEVARELLLERQKVERLSGELAGVEASAAVRDQRLREATERNAFNAVLERARRGLADADAEVFPAGDRLLIRLKSGGLKTLQSVKGVLKALDAHDVVVQGGSTAHASDVAKSLAEVTPVARTVDPAATATALVEVVLKPTVVKR